MVIKLGLRPYTQHISLSEKDIWDFIDLDNRNLTTRFGSDLSVVSRIKPLFDCYVRIIRLTISDWHKAITWLWQFPNWSHSFIRHLRQNWRKLEHGGSLNITNDNDWVISRQSGGGPLIASREEMKVFSVKIPPTSCCLCRSWDASNGSWCEKSCN